MNAARKASPIWASTRACRAGASAASASGPRSIMPPNKLAVSRSVAVRIENKIAATVAVPKAAPTERENCTMAAPVPRSRGPDTACTVTWTTPITVPMNSATPQNAQAISAVVMMRDRKGKNKKANGCADQTVGRKYGGVSRPGHQLARWSSSRCRCLPSAATGSNRSRPARRRARRADRSARNVISETRAAPWHAAMASAAPDRGLAKQLWRNERRGGDAVPARSEARAKPARRRAARAPSAACSTACAALVRAPGSPGRRRR